MELHAAAEANDVVTLSRLLEAGVAVNVRHPSTGLLPLAQAARSHATEACTLLLAHGAKLGNGDEEVRAPPERGVRGEGAAGVRPARGVGGAGRAGPRVQPAPLASAKIEDL